MKRIIIFAIFLSFLSMNTNARVKFTPVADISLTGGQYFLMDEPSSFGGNSSVYFSPVVGFSEKNYLIPVINLNYTGTRDVQELVDGDALTRESVDYGIILKYMYNSPVKATLRTGYKKFLISETKDENFGQGLFDYNRKLIGLELEKKIFGYNIGLTGDYYTINFVNYASLVSQEEYKDSLDTQTYTEISENSGENVLDYSDVRIGIKAQDKKRDMLTLEYFYSIDFRSFLDQSTVQNDGSFSADLRKDIINTIGAGINYNLKRTVLGLKGQTGIVNSNQNSFDENAAKFINDYYSYYNIELFPSIAFLLGNKEKLYNLKFWWSVEYRRYNNRPAQDDEGDYLDEKVVNMDNSWGLYFGYPVAKNITASLSANRRTAQSTMKYEANYKYNYTVTNYYAGFNWQY
ncbi:MAG: hypothetical protein ACOC5R_00465 [Elusimicrobiota bacterium]